MRDTPPLSSDIWLLDLFSSKAARQGGVIRRKARDIERYAGWAGSHAELDRRGVRAVENSGHVVIFSNRATVRTLERPGWTLPPDSREESGRNPPAISPPPLLKAAVPAYICSVPQGTMDINALIISGSDPGAVPGGSTKHSRWGFMGPKQDRRTCKRVALSR